MIPIPSLLQRTARAIWLSGSVLAKVLNSYRRDCSVEDSFIFSLYIGIVRLQLAQIYSVMYLVANILSNLVCMLQEDNPFCE